MQEESSLEMEELGIQDTKINDRVIHKAKRPSKALPKVGVAYKFGHRTPLTFISHSDLLCNFAIVIHSPSRCRLERVSNVRLVFPLCYVLPPAMLSLVISDVSSIFLLL